MRLKRTCLAKSSILILIPLLVSGCVSGPVPKWDGKIYAGSSKDQALIRAQTGEKILSSSKEFDLMMGMTWLDLKTFVHTYIDGCKEWRDDANMVDSNTLFNQLLTPLLPTPTPGPTTK